MTLVVNRVPGIPCDTGFDGMAGQPFSLAFHRYADRLCTVGSSIGKFESCAASHIITANRKIGQKFAAVALNLLTRRTHYFWPGLGKMM